MPSPTRTTLTLRGLDPALLADLSDLAARRGLTREQLAVAYVAEGIRVTALREVAPAGVADVEQMLGMRSAV